MKTVFKLKTFLFHERMITTPVSRPGHVLGKPVYSFPWPGRERAREELSEVSATEVMAASKI